MKFDNVKDAARRLGLGKIALYAYHKPVGLTRKSIREGGPIQQLKTARGKREMIEAAGHLPELLRPVADNGLTVYFMTGSRYWYQTVFCFFSLQKNVPDEVITPILIDDGTLTEAYVDKIRRVVPWVEVWSLATIEERLDQYLPSSKYPTLRERRNEQPLIRKVLDLHVGERGWKMLLDSDMLFFRRPDHMLQWLRNPRKPYYMVDCMTAYGYSDALRRELAEHPIPDRINIGMFGWKSDDVDVDKLEYWVKTLLEREGTHYNLTQGLCSMMYAGRESEVAPERDYLVLPDVEEGKSPIAIMHHYVAESKRAYFQYGWRHI